MGPHVSMVICAPSEIGDAQSRHDYMKPIRSLLSGFGDKFTVAAVPGLTQVMGRPLTSQRVLELKRKLPTGTQIFVRTRNGKVLRVLHMTIKHVLENGANFELNFGDKTSSNNIQPTIVHTQLHLKVTPRK
jgi:hypothetical protein